MTGRARSNAGTASRDSTSVPGTCVARSEDQRMTSQHPHAPESRYENDVVLRDGSTVFVRPVRPDDGEALHHLIQGLSERSAYFRFFTIPRSPDREVHRLVACDGDESAAMVAELAGRIVGVASYVRQPGRPAHAEVAFAVSDVAQGHGIGTQLLLPCRLSRAVPASRSSRPTYLATTTRCCRSSAVQGSPSASISTPASTIWRST